MRIITVRTHAFIDYIVGIGLIVVPPLIGHPPHHAAAMWVPMVMGAITIMYSLFTRYELGVIRVLPFRAHLAMDGLSGTVMLLSPWLFGFASAIWWPHVVVGLCELSVTAMSLRLSPEIAADIGPLAERDNAGRPQVQ